MALQARTSDRDDESAVLQPAHTAFRAHAQEIDAHIAGWARRQRGEHLIGAFIVLVEMAARNAFISRKEKGGGSAHHTPQVTPPRFAELAATAHCLLPPILPSSRVCAPAVALALPLPPTLPPFLFGKE
jgi:hypothetical protein